MTWQWATQSPLDGGTWLTDGHPCRLADIATEQTVAEHAETTVELAGLVARLAELAGDGPSSTLVRTAVRHSCRHVDAMVAELSDVMATRWDATAQAAHASWPQVAAARAEIPTWATEPDPDRDFPPAPATSAAASSPTKPKATRRAPKKSRTTRREQEQARRAAAMAAADPSELAAARVKVTQPVSHKRIEPIPVPRDSRELLLSASALEQQFHPPIPGLTRPLAPGRSDVDAITVAKMYAAAHPTLWATRDVTVLADADDDTLASLGAFDATAELDIVMPYAAGLVGYTAWMVGKVAHMAHLAATDQAQLRKSPVKTTWTPALERLGEHLGEARPGWLVEHPPGTVPPLGSMAHETTVAAPDGSYVRDLPFWWPDPRMFVLFGALVRGMLVEVDERDAQFAPARRRWRLADDPTRDGGHHPAPSYGASHIIATLAPAITEMLVAADDRPDALVNDAGLYDDLTALTREAAGRQLGRDAPGWRYTDDEIDEMVAEELQQRQAAVPDPADVAWGERLRDARVAAGWSQAELAEHLDVSTPAVSRWENGSPPNDDNRTALVAILPALTEVTAGR